MPRKMTRGEIKKAVEQQIERSSFFDDSERQANQKAAIDSYLGRRRSASIPGRSGAVSQDVADMVESLTAEIMPAFHFDEVAVFGAHGAQDVDQANLESKICNQMLFDVNDGEVEIQAAIRDGLLLRNAILKCYLQETKDVSHERYENIDELELMQLQEGGPDQEINITLIEPGRPDHFNVNLTRTFTFRRLNIEAIDPTQFLIEREYTSINPQDAQVVGERRFETRSELVAQGFNRATVDKIAATSTDTRIGSLSRNRDESPANWDFTDKALERIEVFELYMRLDVDNDGVSERRRIIYAGQVSAGVILSNEPHSFVPYACGTPFLYPHRFQGLSLFDKLEELEKVKTKAMRQYIDNLESANFPELVVEDGAVAAGDYTTRRPSGVIRADNVNAVRELPVTDIGSSSLAFIRYMDQVRAERGGATLDLQSGQGQLASESAHGTERMFATKEKLAELICSTFSSTLVKQLFRLIHQNLREFFIGEQNFKVGDNQFVSTDTASWPVRNQIRVTVGLSAHERDRQRQVLGEHLLQQEKLFAAGMDGVLMSKQTYFNTLVDWSKAGGMMSPRRMWIDPRSDEAIQAEQSKQQQQQAAAQKEEALQDKVFATNVLIGDRENRTDMVKHITELRFKYWDSVLSSEIEELRVQAQGSEVASPDPDEIDKDQNVGRDKANQLSAGSAA